MNIARVVRAVPSPLRRHRLVRALLRIAPGSAIQEVRFNGDARLFADVSDAFPRAYLLSGVFEPEFFSIAMPFLRRGGTFLDVGAHYGFCTFGLIAALAGRPPVTYYLVEANPHVCDTLRRSAALHSGTRIVVTHGCATHVPGESRLKVPLGHSGGAHIAPDGTERAPHVVLDDHLDEHGVERVALMKMDVEGMEPLALHGAHRSLASGRIQAVYVEVSAETLARSGFGPAAVLDPLLAAGFDVYHVKAEDLGTVSVAARGSRRLRVNGVDLVVAPVASCLATGQTDLLAIHRTAPIEVEANGR